MQATPNYALPLYELDDAANLADGYNNAMGKIDAALKATDDKFPITGAEIEDGSITTADLANGSVTTNKLATAAVTDDKLAIGAVTASAIEDNAVTTPAIEDLSVTNEKIANGTLGLEKFSPEALEGIVPSADSITTEMLQNGAVTKEKIDPALLDDFTVADGSITLAKIAPSAIDSEAIENSPNLITSGAVFKETSDLNQEILSTMLNGVYDTTVERNFSGYPTEATTVMQLSSADNNQYIFLSLLMNLPAGTYTSYKIPGTAEGVNVYGLKLPIKFPDGWESKYYERCIYQSNASNRASSTTLYIGSDGYAYLGYTRTAGATITLPQTDILTMNLLLLNNAGLNLIDEMRLINLLNSELGA